MTNRPWDLVVYGATGDAGKAIAIYVAENMDRYKKSGSEPFRWAIAGRSEAKLNALRSRLNSAKSNSDVIGVLTANVTSVSEMSELAKSTRVLISTVGPYTLLGESVFAACVAHGTHYVDITGEVDWVGSMRDKYQEQARESGSTLCSFSGYDCVPCDITTYVALQKLSECDGTDSTILSSLETVSDSTGGVFPRGTLRTSITKHKAFWDFCGKLTRFPSPDGSIHRRTRLALFLWLLPNWSSEHGTFTIPHYMGWCNIPVIYKSHESSIQCVFHDRSPLGFLPGAMLYFFVILFAPGYFCFQILCAFIPSTCDLLLRLFDSMEYRGNHKDNEQQLEDMTTEVWNYATSSLGTKSTVYLRIKGDPGMKATAVLTSETAFSILDRLDKNELPKGIIGSTPEIVGDTLVERLRDGPSTTLTVTIAGQNNKKED